MEARRNRQWWYICLIARRNYLQTHQAAPPVLLVVAHHQLLQLNWNYTKLSYSPYQSCSLLSSSSSSTCSIFAVVVSIGLRFGRVIVIQHYFPTTTMTTMNSPLYASIWVHNILRTIFFLIVVNCFWGLFLWNSLNWDWRKN